MNNFLTLLFSFCVIFLTLGARVVSNPPAPDGCQMDDLRPLEASDAPAAPAAPLPDFAQYTDVKQRKQAFFDFLLPMVRAANAQILNHRAQLHAMHGTLAEGCTLGAQAHQNFQRLAKRYALAAQTATQEAILQLLTRVDVVPESLALAQAANESGWGMSRFAKQANNLFGVYCHSKGCGISPSQRGQGRYFEVKKYESVQDGIHGYIHNINTHSAYQTLRRLRAEARLGDLALSGMALAQGLVRYSIRGEEYVKEIQQMIRVNKLHRFTHRG